MRKFFKIVFLVFGVLSFDACKNDSVRPPENRNPIILSVTAFPDTISATDSVIVMCNAIDPDGNALVYDWFTDSRLRIKGEPVDEGILYNTHENFHVFYAAHVNVPVDTAWVSCEVRDGIGGVASFKPVLIVVKQN